MCNRLQQSDDKVCGYRSPFVDLVFIVSTLQNLGVDRISLDDRKSKSFEERTEEYLEARSRIFKEVTLSWWHMPKFQYIQQFINT